MAKKAEKLWPVAKYLFQVEIGGDVFSFQEVTGLTAEVASIDYRTGGVDLTVKKLTGLHKGSNVTMKKGIFEGDKDIKDIFYGDKENNYLSEDKKLDIKVDLLGEKSQIIMSWIVSQAFPVKLTGPDLKSTDNSIAIESIEFVCENILIV